MVIASPRMLGGVSPARMPDWLRIALQDAFYNINISSGNEMLSANEVHSLISFAKAMDRRLKYSMFIIAFVRLLGPSGYCLEKHTQHTTKHNTTISQYADIDYSMVIWLNASKN